MRDRFTRGLLAGAAGGIAASLLNALLVKGLGIGELVFSDFAGVLIFGRTLRGFWERLFAVWGHVGFSAGLGVVFAYLIAAVSSRYYLVKGAVYGLAVWFITYSLTVLFKVPGLVKVSFGTALSDYIASAVYGLVLAWVLHRLDAGTKTAT